MTDQKHIKPRNKEKKTSRPRKYFGRYPTKEDKVLLRLGYQGEEYTLASEISNSEFLEMQKNHPRKKIEIKRFLSAPIKVAAGKIEIMEYTRLH